MHCNNRHTIAICMIMPGLFGIRFLPGGCLHHILGYACNLYVFYYCCRGMGVRTLGRTVGLCLKLSILLEFDNKYFRKYRLRAIVVFSTFLHTPPPPSAGLSFLFLSPALHSLVGSDQPSVILIYSDRKATLMLLALDKPR